MRLSIGIWEVYSRFCFNTAKGQNPLRLVFGECEKNAPKKSFNTAKGQNPLRHAQGNLVEQTEWQFQYRERAEPFAAA